MLVNLGFFTSRGGKGLDRGCCRTHLLPGNGHVVLHVPKDCGLDEVAPVCSGVATTQQLGSLPLPTADVAQDLLELLLVHLRARRGHTSAPLGKRFHSDLLCSSNSLFQQAAEPTPKGNDHF